MNVVKESRHIDVAIRGLGYTMSYDIGNFYIRCDLFIPQFPAFSLGFIIDVIHSFLLEYGFIWTR